MCYFAKDSWTYSDLENQVWHSYLKCSVEWEDVNQCKFDPFVLFWKVNATGQFISIEGYKPVGFQF